MIANIERHCRRSSQGSGFGILARLWQADVCGTLCRLGSPDPPCHRTEMIGRPFTAAALIICMSAPSHAQDAVPAYDFQERTRELAFDPARLFPEQSQPALSIRYLGDDYGFPVYALAVRRGCVDADQGEARRTCGARLTARMVRSSFNGRPPRPRVRGQRLFAFIAQSKPQNDDALLRSLDAAGLEWLEADVRSCIPAMAHLATGHDLKFSPGMDITGSPAEIVLHADKVTFEVSDYLKRSRYDGWLKPGSPAAWANDFAASLESCWRPSTAVVPWRAAEK